MYYRDTARVEEFRYNLLLAASAPAVGVESVIVLAALLTDAITVPGAMACAGILVEPLSATDIPA